MSDSSIKFIFLKKACNNNGAGVIYDQFVMNSTQCKSGYTSFSYSNYASCIGTPSIGSKRCI